MIGDSVLEVLLIRTAILALRAITPLSFLYLTGVVVASFLVHWRPGWAPRILAYYALAECLFFLFIYIPHKRQASTIVPAPPTLTRPERLALFTRCLAAVDDAESFLRGWFKGAPLDSIKRENVREWVTGAFLSPAQAAHLASSAAWIEESDVYIAEMQAATGLTFEPGKTDGVEPMRLYFDGVHVVCRPLLWYIIVAVVDAVTHISLAFFGLAYYTTSRWFESFPYRPLTLFTRHYSPRDNISYWYRPHRSVDKDPVVIIHGIGIGLLAYIQLIRDAIRLDPTLGFVIVEVLPISMRMLALDRPASNPLVFCEDLRAILEFHGWIDPLHGVGASADGGEHRREEDRLVDVDVSGPELALDMRPGTTAVERKKFVLVGHSYGTFLAAHILRPSPHSFPSSLTPAPSPSLAPSISSIILLDPIPFLLFYPFLVHNFVYRVPGRMRANEWMLWYFTSRDAGIATLIARGFHWVGGVLFWEDMSSGGGRSGGQEGGDRNGRKVLVVIGGRDQVIDGWKVWHYLTKGTPAPSPRASQTYSPALDIAHLNAEEEEQSQSQLKDTDTRIWRDPHGARTVVLNTQLDHAQILISAKKRAFVVERIVQRS